jgi:tetratricopeptide (TPR) repeat protein
MNQRGGSPLEIAEMVLARTFGEVRRGQYFGLLVAAIAFLVYANSLGNGFVWDDDVVIVANPALRGSALSLFSTIDTGRAIELTPYYRPLTVLTFLIEERAHGLTPFPMHLVNVLLHAANAFLVYLLARSLVIDTYAALLAGLLFAVHPINTEAVDFISARNTLLSGFFILVAYLLHRRSIIRENFSGALAGAVFLLAGLFSKETALAGLPFIIAQEITQLRSTSGRLRAVGRLLPYAVCIASYLVLRNNTLSNAGVKIAVLSGLGMRLLDNLYIIPRYLLTVLWPTALSAKYFIPDDLHLLALPLGAAWICIIALLAWLSTRGRSHVTLFGLAWLTAFWLPVSGIFPIPSAPFADRYLYIPAIGLWLVVSDQAFRLVPANVTARRYGVIAAALILLMLAGLTVRRNLDWKGDISLFSRIVEQYPEQAFGHHNLGCAYLDKLRSLDLAEEEFQRALALDPLFPRLRTQLGYIQLLRGDYAGAVQHYNEAVFQNPFDAEAFLNRAIALDRLGRYGDAVADYKRFLAMPGNELAGARPQAEARVRELTK